MIEVRGLCKTFGKTRAVDDISFTVDAGDVFGFIGPNGAGKTTTIRILATLLEPTAGSATIDGYCVRNYPDRVRKVIGYMPDFYDVYQGITVLEYLDFFGAAFKLERRERARTIGAVLELTDLQDMQEKLVSTLSKGMRQRLCLAKTLVHDPKVLILDEPASGLDPRARIEIRELLKELSQMGKTIFISSHILTELSEICNRVGIIEHGWIVVSGTVAEISHSLQQTCRLIVSIHNPTATGGNGNGDVPPSADVLRAVQLVRRHPLVAAADCENHRVVIDFNGTSDQIKDVIKLLVNDDIPVVGIEEEQHDLEDLFMKLTRGDLA